jgi:hypothetical protein
MRRGSFIRIPEVSSNDDWIGRLHVKFRLSLLPSGGDSIVWFSEANANLKFIVVPVQVTGLHIRHCSLRDSSKFV